MKKTVFLIGSITLFLATFVVIKKLKKPSAQAQFRIGILQTASHPALDAVREGFMAQLTSKLGNAVHYTIQNAQGSIHQAHALAQQFHADTTLNCFFAIATPATQALSAVEKERPLIIAAVTDPQALGIIHPSTNVCGIHDMVDVPAEITMLTQLLPSARTVGLLYTSGETNSIALVQKMDTDLQARGLKAIHFAASGELDIQATAEKACRTADVILAPTDNTVASTITLLAKVTRFYKKPFIVSDNLLVSFGALASQGVDYRLCGQQAADIALQVLIEGKKPFTLPIEQAKSDTLVLNETTLALLGIPVPESLKARAVFVKDNS